MIDVFQVIAAAQAGQHNEKRESYGDSLIIDPWGTVVGRLPGLNSLQTHTYMSTSVCPLSLSVSEQMLEIFNA